VQCSVFGQTLTLPKRRRQLQEKSFEPSARLLLHHCGAERQVFGAPFSELTAIVWQQHASLS
jgi:hypothetical protein